MKENNLGETVNDWLKNAAQRGIQVFQVPYLELLQQIGQKVGIPKLSMLMRKEHV
jgi:hypothetical protein